MKTPALLLLLALSFGTLAAGTAPPTPAPKLTKWQQFVRDRFANSAPADEYFGRTKLSYLGMNNTFRDASISSGDHTTDTSIVNKVKLAEEALDAWAKKYPRDPQLPRTLFLAFQEERKIWVKDNQDRAWAYLNRLVHDFPDSYFGKTLKRDLAIGFTEHYYALPQPCATPPPEPSSGAPAPALTPSPGPAATTIAKGLRAQVVAPPCVPAPAPSPSPASPLPSPLASPT